MSLLSLLDTFTKQAPLFLIVTTAYIISAIIIRVLKKNISSISAYIMKGLAKVLMVSTIPMLITIYSSAIVVNSFVSSLSNITNVQMPGATNLLLSLPAIFSLGVSIILGVAILFMESERFVSPLTKEIENVNINNLEKIAIKLLDIVPFILSIALVYSILFLAIFPTNMTLINTILIISQVYLYIIVFDIIFSILAAVSSKGLEPNINIGKI
jgi:hypothetical protein